MLRHKSYILALITLCLVGLWFFQPSAQEQITFPTATLTIQTAGEPIPFTVEVATIPAQHEHGLMFRKTVPDKTGMIFIFDTPKPIDMWMKNTLVPLDMIFIANNGTITQIAENATPLSTTIIASESDTRAVVEVAGGTAKRYHIAKGDRVLYSIFP